MKRFAAALERKLGKDAVVTLYARIAELEAYAQKLSRDREVGAVMREKDPKLVKLYQYVGGANEPMFELMRRISSPEKKAAPSRKQRTLLARFFQSHPL